MSQYENTEKPWRFILQNEVELMKQKFIISIQVWKPPLSPCRAPDFIGPYCIQMLTFLLIKSFQGNGKIAFSFMSFIPILLISLFIIKTLIKMQMVNPSIAQIFNIMSYSQIYLICFGFIARFFTNFGMKLLFYIPGLSFMFFSVHHLSMFIVPDDALRIVDLCLLVHGILLVFWMWQSFDPFPSNY